MRMEFNINRCKHFDSFWVQRILETMAMIMSIIPSIIQVPPSLYLIQEVTDLYKVIWKKTNKSSLKCFLFETNSIDRTMLGAKQLQHLKDWLITHNSSVSFKFIISPVPLSFYTGDMDAWQSSDFRAEREDILNFIDSNAINGVIFLSSSRQGAFVWKLRNKFLEISVSPQDAWDIPFTRPKGTGFFFFFLGFL